MTRLMPVSLRHRLAALALPVAIGLGPGCATVGPDFVAPLPPPVVHSLPGAPASTKFFVIGDFGNARREQYELAAVMARLLETFPADVVLTVGDNIYGRERPQDFVRKFEAPYARLLDAGVMFRASLGNHDSRDQVHYPLFNMGGQAYYAFTSANRAVRFIALDSGQPTPEQLAWLDGELGRPEAWKVPYFHHPLYSSGRRHGPHRDLRDALEPRFVQAGVGVLFAGHEHFYERTAPQQGIVHFIVGSGGQLRPGNIDRGSGITAAGFDTDRAFLAVEVDGDVLTFNAVSRLGHVVDSGQIRRPPGAS